MIRSRLLVTAALAALAVGSARADFLFTPGAGPSALFSFTSTTGGTSLCAAANTHCYAQVPINSAGAPLFVSGNAGYVQFPSAQAISGTVTANAGTGNFTVTQATAANFNATVVGTGTFATQAAQSGTWNITNISGTVSLPTGAATAANQTSVIGTKAAGTAATNALLTGCTYNATPVALTDGQQASCQGTSAGAGYVFPGTQTTTLSGWTSGTSLNATQTLMTAANGAPAILLQLNQTSTISAGATTIEGTYDGTNWVTVPVAQILNPNTFANLTNPYTLVASTNQPFLILTQGYQSVRVRLSTVITGSATVTPFVTLLPTNPVIASLLNPLAAGSAIIGKVGIDQTTDGTTNGVRPLAGATGGASTTGNIVANNTTAVVVKASAGTLYGAQVYGIGSAPAYLKIYNATSATCGSGTPVKRLMIPAASTAANGAGSNVPFGDVGIAFGTGITYCVTTGIADNDTTAPAATTYLVNLDWK